MNYKLVAIDMDGTLLNSHNEVSERTRQAIDDASKQGVKIVLATGRLLKSAVNYSDQLNLYKPIIACNGAVIIDEGRNKLYEKSINMDLVENIMDLGCRSGIYYHLYDNDSFYTNMYVEEIVRFYNTKDAKENGTEIKVNIFKSKEDIIKNNDISILKFLFLDDDKNKLHMLRNKLSLLKGISVCSSWNNNIEVMDENVSKGNSLKYLCQSLNIPPEKVIAIGDNENDISMLEYAGLGVAMGNAEEKVRSLADFVTSTNDQDGVAKIIEKYILKTGDEA